MGRHRPAVVCPPAVVADLAESHHGSGEGAGRGGRCGSCRKCRRRSARAGCRTPRSAPSPARRLLTARAAGSTRHAAPPPVSSSAWSAVCGGCARSRRTPPTLSWPPGRCGRPSRMTSTATASTGSCCRRGAGRRRRRTRSHAGRARPAGCGRFRGSDFSTAGDARRRAGGDGAGGAGSVGVGLAGGRASQPVVARGADRPGERLGTAPGRRAAAADVLARS